MQSTDFQRLKNTLSKKNKLATLTEYNTLLSKIAEKLVYEMEQPNDLTEIMNIIKTQKSICEIAENLYEHLQKEDVNVETAVEQIDGLEDACREHEKHYEKYMKECREERIGDKRIE